MEFGARLREARERRGLTLREISVRTKISYAHLEALERNQISRLPGGIFSRAFVRAYAEQVGLDPERAVQEFLDAFAVDGLDAGRAHVEIEDNQAIESRQRAAEAVVKLLLVSAPLAIGVLYFTLGGRSAAPSEEPPLAAAREAYPLESSPIQPALGVGVPDNALDADLETLTVALRSSRECWVSATVDGAQVLSRVLRAGEEPVLRVRQELVLTAGDSGALGLAINGEATGPLGGDGQVTTIRVTPANYRTLLSGR